MKTEAEKRACKKYREANREELNGRARAKRVTAPDQTRAACKRYYAKNRERLVAAHRAWELKNPERAREIHNAGSRRKRESVLNAYGHTCRCCGEARSEFLAVDHVNGGGDRHRKSVGGNIYTWLRRNNFPEGFRILCHNCNMSLGFYGRCPHNEERPLRIFGLEEAA